jgi:hypothetical protein
MDINEEFRKYKNFIKEKEQYMENEEHSDEPLPPDRTEVYYPVVIHIREDIIGRAYMYAKANGVQIHDVIATLLTDPNFAYFKFQPHEENQNVCEFGFVPIEDTL